MGALTSFALQAAIILTYPFIPQHDIIYIKDGKEISIEELMTIENSSITAISLDKETIPNRLYITTKATATK
ncbi:MAG: hypothetical protein LIP09_10075 [Bacteroidales bacterium]|nr:hypothetical protein [Bacteroidales bacterium]